MFGEKPIVGESQILVSKGRKIILPEYTYAEPNENLGVMFGLGRVAPELTTHDPLNRTRIVIMQLQEFEEKLDILDRRSKELRDNGTIDYRRYYDLQRIIYGMLAISREKVNALRKIEIQEYPIKKLNIGSSVYAVGEEKRLVLYPTREQYLSTKNQKVD